MPPESFVLLIQDLRTSSEVTPSGPNDPLQVQRKPTLIGVPDAAAVLLLPVAAAVLLLPVAAAVLLLPVAAVVLLLVLFVLLTRRHSRAQ